MTVATPEDVEARLGRPLLPLEMARVAAVLEDVEAEIQRLAPGILELPAFESRIRKVECQVTLRATRLAESINLVIPSDGTVAFNPDTSVVGDVTLRRNEWRTLGVRQAGKARGLPPVTPLSCIEGDGTWTP